jgi:hypothetical protein
MGSLPLAGVTVVAVEHAVAVAFATIVACEAA